MNFAKGCIGVVAISFFGWSLVAAEVQIIKLGTEKLQVGRSVSGKSIVMLRTVRKVNILKTVILVSLRQKTERTSFFT